MSTTVWSSTGGTTVSQSLADQAATSATNAAASATAAATSETNAAASATAAATSETNAAASAAAGLAKVSSNDSTAAVLSSKIVGDGSTLTVTETNDGSNETLTLSTTGLQAADATLTALAGLTVSADQMIYATGSDAFATTGLTSAARALIDDADVATMRGTLGLGTAATSASTAFLASASPTVSSGTLTVTANGITFSDGTSQTSASAGGGSLTVQEEGVALANNASVLNFVGSGVTASGSGATKTITISTGGGGGGMSDLSDDSSPTLGGDLDTGGHDIVTASNANLDLAPNGNGYVVVRGNNNSGKIMLNCESNSHGVSIASPPHSASATYDLVLPTSLSAGAVFTSSGGQLSTGDLPVADGGTGASDAAGAQQNLGLQIGSDVQAYDAGLNSIAGLTTSADKMIYTTGSDTYAVTTISAAGRAILDDADSAAQRQTLGLGTMAVAATSDYVAKAGSTMSGQLVLHSTGLQFSDSTTLTTAPTAGVSAGKAIALAMIFGG